MPAILVRSWLLLAADIDSVFPSDGIVWQVFDHRRRVRHANKAAISRLYQKDRRGVDTMQQRVTDNTNGSLLDIRLLPQLWASWYLGKFAGVFSDWVTKHMSSVIGQGSSDSSTVEQGPAVVGAYDRQQHTRSSHIPSPFTSSTVPAGAVQRLAAGYSADKTPALPRQDNDNDSAYYAGYSSSHPSNLTPPTNLFGAPRVPDVVFESLSESVSPLSDKCKGLLLLLLHNKR